VSAWPNLAELLVGADASAPIALVGAPLSTGSVTPGACHRAPDLVRRTLKRIGRYDIETGHELWAPIADLGDIDISGLSIEQATGPIAHAIGHTSGAYPLTLLVGGNNAITRPAVLGLNAALHRVGLITLDAHFDMRSLEHGLSNGNPVRALLEDGLPGRNIAQIGLASFANSAEMHRDAEEAGNLILSMGEVREIGIAEAVSEALDHVAQCEVIVVDCDIDVIDRSQLPGAPGARPGGMPVTDFYWAVRRLASDPRVRVIDLTELDPSLDSTDLSGLTAARWVAECVAGYELR
jgi:formiminoglutamase